MIPTIVRYRVNTSNHVLKEIQRRQKIHKIARKNKTSWIMLNFSTSKKEVETLIELVIMFDQAIKDEIWHWEMYNAYNKIFKNTSERIELPNQESFWTLRKKESYKHLGVLEADTIKQTRMKERVRKEYLEKKLLKTKLCHRNLTRSTRSGKTGWGRYFSRSCWSDWSLIIQTNSIFTDWDISWKIRRNILWSFKIKMIYQILTKKIRSNFN